jgi:hypothetical protein
MEARLQEPLLCLADILLVFLVISHSTDVFEMFVRFILEVSLG